MNHNVDERFMDEALALAERGRGRTSPNPMVGAVVVRDNEIVGRGWHPAAGEPHAEAFALREAGDRTRGATIYVTLEPCSHHGRTPPCSDAVIAAGVTRVVAGMEDPHPKVAGSGFARLREAGIAVDIGVREAACRRLNEVYITRIVTGMPFVTLKIAASLDGRIATSSGHSHWITGPAAREQVHRMRDEHDAVLIGIGTLLKDNPLLTTRLPGGGGRNAYRIVVDSRLRTPLHANIFGEDGRERLIVFTAVTDRKQIAPYQERSLAVLHAPDTGNGILDLADIMRQLAARDICSVLIEGGAEIGGSAMDARIVHKVCFFYAPRIIGGRGAVGMLGGTGITTMHEAIDITEAEITRFGPDFCVTGYVSRPPAG
ncbi:MAG: bifunctional diaminohydroxyphosphoribosylaminopyrimidine deaminase/5-amino-6-(5-phosphoribosylamino)uracil reductase RibD [Deltaproteobacteria bacterium]|nr:bifunctional diaminohydroxyphosphoribosylaminopyrimidine deaminase/5-amino-6-(5-phosphoribosylamino)uracil reductase RibD [Candidatus Anaeroferrophillacea bacterium]